MNLRQNLFSMRWSTSILAVALILAGGVLASGQEDVIYRFKNPDDGTNPDGGLISDSAGNLYGTTCGGGPGGYKGAGTVFELAQQGGEWTKTSIEAFSGGAGHCPEGNLIFDQAGNLYGVTADGGLGCGDIGCGTAYELTRQGSTWTYTLIYAFQGGTTDGQTPAGGLVFDKAGNLYGTSVWGGDPTCQDGCGTGFQLTPSQGGNWTETVIHFFGRGHDGAKPDASLIVDDKGNLFGTTQLGGTTGNGTVFKLDAPATQGGVWTEHVLYNLKGMPDGSAPHGALIFDQAGNLDGATISGGSFYGGTVFQLTRGQDGGWTENVLHSFCSQSKCADGADPVGGLKFDKAGDLYGTTSAGFGTVFELAPPTTQGGAWTETVLYDFTSGKDGWGPLAGLTRGKFGVLYGTTANGGNEGKNCTFNVGCGTVFKIKP
jgi:uncharacterized repeat protein (TIGR03803 family)